MIFSSTIFIFGFLPIVLGIYYIPFFKNNRKFKNYFLLFASLLFYAWGEPIFVLLMLLSILVTYFVGLRIAESRKKKTVLTIGVIYHIGVLFVFKYMSFILHEICNLIGIEQIQLDITLPIGISFFTFQMLSYLFDVYYGNAKVQNNFLYLALYVSFFPQLIAGPIVRYETVENEIQNRQENICDVQDGLRRFVCGLGKKALLADYLAVIADNIFVIAGIKDISMLTAWIGAVAYMLEIYFDFSGYSDMAIGLGRCFGFHFKENFNKPYLAESINDFWKRWHISLTDWFRDYVYIPMGGNRVNKTRHIWNIVLVWILTGIWHGANWTFLVWGITYCVLQLAEKYCYRVNTWPRVLRHLYTLVIVCLCWVIFKADNLHVALKYILDMFGHSQFIDSEGMYYFKNSIGTIIIGVLFCLPFGLCIEKRKISNRVFLVKEIVTYVCLCAILIMTAVLSISGGYSPFIYFNF